MATVRFSDELKQRIRRNANEMFSVRLHNASKLDMSGLEGDGNYFATFIYENIFSGEQRQHMLAIKDFLNETKDVRVFKVNGHTVDERYVLPSEMPWPEFGYNEFELPNAIISSRYGINLKGDVWADFEKRVVERNNKKEKLSEELNSFLVGVNTLMERHVTLAPALREWKQLWELLPEYTKDKHKEVKTRAKPEPIANLEGVDLDKMTSVIGRNRIMGGK